MTINNLVKILTVSTVFLLGKAAYPKNDSAELEFNLGKECYYNKDYTYAKKHFKEAVRLDNRNSKYYIAVGNVYFKLEDWQKAINYYNQFLLFNPRNVYTLERMSEAYLELGNKDNKKLAKMLSKAADKIKKAQRFLKKQ